MKDETEAALRMMQTGNAMGEGGIATEMLEALGDFGIKIMREIANTIYSTGRLTD